MNFKKITVSIIIAIVSMVFSFIYFQKANFAGKDLFHPEVDQKVQSFTPTFSPSAQTSTSESHFQQTIENVLNSDKNSYAVAIKNLKTGENYFLNTNDEFETASLYKLWIMSTTYNQIEKGLLNEDDILSRNVSVLNSKFDIDEEATELKEGIITMTVGEALNKMITVSDNYAALLLSEKIRLSAVTNFLQKNGFLNSQLGQPPKTTVSDIALFLEKLYRGQLANMENTQKMMELLRKQTLNQKLPKLLPKETIIAHKTGELGSVSHDAGIVFTDKGDYIIVVLSDTNQPDEANKRISQISKAVYDYFSKE